MLLWLHSHGKGWPGHVALLNQPGDALVSPKHAINATVRAMAVDQDPVVSLTLWMWA